MKAWFYENHIVVTRLIGVLLLLGATVLFFWGNPTSSGMSIEEQRAAERVARMEARVQSVAAHAAKAPKVDYAKAYSEHTKTQTRLMLIMMMLLGALFLGYSFIKKRKSLDD